MSDREPGDGGCDAGGSEVLQETKQCRWAARSQADGRPMEAQHRRIFITVIVKKYI